MLHINAPPRQSHIPCAGPADPRMHTSSMCFKPRRGLFHFSGRDKDSAHTCVNAYRWNAMLTITNMSCLTPPMWTDLGVRHIKPDGNIKKTRAPKSGPLNLKEANDQTIHTYTHLVRLHRCSRHALHRWLWGARSRTSHLTNWMGNKG